MRSLSRITFHILTLAAVASVLAGPAAAAPRVPFVSQPTSSIEGLGDYTSAELDGMGRTHVAYFDVSRGALVYATQTQSGWRTELVDADGTVGWYASLALDSRGIAFR